MGIVFVSLSNYFNVLSPQVTGFIIDFVQKSLHLPGYKPNQKMANYDVLVEKFTYKIQFSEYTISKVVALCGIVILLLAALRSISHLCAAMLRM